MMSLSGSTDAKHKHSPPLQRKSFRKDKLQPLNRPACCTMSLPDILQVLLIQQHRMCRVDKAPLCLDLHRKTLMDITIQMLNLMGNANQTSSFEEKFDFRKMILLGTPFLK
jgi:hypothetical protein